MGKGRDRGAPSDASITPTSLLPHQGEGGHSAVTILFPEVFATEHPIFEGNHEQHEVSEKFAFLRWIT